MITTKYIILTKRDQYLTYQQIDQNFVNYKIHVVKLMVHCLLEYRFLLEFDK